MQNMRQADDAPPSGKKAGTIIRCGHIGLTVAVLDRSRDFYRDLFEFEEFFRVRRTEPWIGAQVGYMDADIEFCHMRGPGGMHLELLQYRKPFSSKPIPDDTYRAGSTHINFWVDDIYAMVEKVEKYIERMEFPGQARFAPHPLDVEATTITSGPQTGGKGFYMRDPDGHTLELWQPAKTPIAQGFGR